MRYKVGCELGYDAAAPASLTLNLKVARLAQQRLVREHLAITPEMPVETWTMPESGNIYDRLRLPAGAVSIRYDAEVELEALQADVGAVGETAPADLPFAAMPHTYPSRFCPSDRFVSFAERTFRAGPAGHLRVGAVCNWIYEHVDYLPGTSDEHTSAADTFVERKGVCRDFAHLGVTLTRALGIPARLVSAYALGLEPPDFHAAFEAYLDGRWYLFDPTRQADLGGIVRIGIGRDAADVAFATFHGPVRATGMRIWIHPADGAGPAERTTGAVTISAT